MILLATTDWYVFFFLLFAIIACGFAAAVLFTSNIVRMAFFLTLSLGATAGLFFLAGAQFVGAMQLMIYVGGTLVLLIFGVMLTAQTRFISMRTSSGEWIAALIVGSALLALLMSTAFGVDAWRTAHDASSLDVAEAQTATALGAGLSGVRVDRLNDESADDNASGMSGYLLPFVIISVHLLVVLIGAAYMARGKFVEHDEPVPAVDLSLKRRHMSVTVWMALMLLSNLTVVTAILFNVSQLYLPLFDLTDAPIWFLATALLVTFAQAVSVLALFSWQRWGFAGICITAVLLLVSVSIALDFPTLLWKVVEQAILIGVLYWLLKNGNENSVWAQLEPRRETG